MEKWQLEVRQTLFLVIGADEDRITTLFVDSEVITSIFR
jgi:hypothetical protein